MALMKTSHKIILTLSVVLVAGYTWSLDMPLALEVPLREQPYNFSNFDFNLLYFATYIAICFSDMPVGMLLDKLPIKKTILCISLISIISEIGILLMFYLQFTGYTIFIYIFRGIFGIMGQALFTIQALLISKYGGKYYDMLIGVGICAPLIFDSINNIATPSIFDATNSMELVWGIGVFFCLLAFCFSLVIAHLITKEQRERKQFKNQSETQSAKTQQTSQEEQLNFNGLKSMPRQFWVIVGAVFFTQNAAGSYLDNLNDTIVKRFQISYVNAGYLMFLPYGFAAFMSLVLGFVLQKKPKYRRKLIISSTLVYSAGLMIMYLLPNIQKDEETPLIHYFVIAIQFMSVSYLLSILFGVLSSAIVYIVSYRHLGIAWGVIGSTIGISQAIAPLIAAWILESQDSLADAYKMLTLYTFFTSLFALGFSVWILIGDFSRIDVNSNQKILYDGQKLNQSLLETENGSQQIQN